MNNKTLVVGLAIFCLLIAALISRNGEIAWMLMPFLIYLGLGILPVVVLDAMIWFVRLPMYIMRFLQKTARWRESIRICT